MFFCLLEEASQSVEHPVVGDRERFHPEFRCTGTELICPATTIQQTVVCMDVQVDEFGIFSRHRVVRLKVRFSMASRSYAQCRLVVAVIQQTMNHFQ
jgi:hypothetical protein